MENKKNKVRPTVRKIGSWSFLSMKPLFDCRKVKEQVCSPALYPVLNMKMPSQLFEILGPAYQFELQITGDKLQLPFLTIYFFLDRLSRVVG